MIDVTIGSHKCLTGLTLNERIMIEQELTFDNPKYAQIMKYSKWGNTREPQYLEYFNYFHKDGELVMQVPVGYKIPDSIEINNITDERCLVQVPNFPKFAMELRDTQKEALQKYIECNESSINVSGSIQLPTGKGKTILGLAIAEHYSCRTLVIVHKVDLVNGWIKNIKEAFDNKADVGIIRASSRK